MSDADYQKQKLLLVFLKSCPKVSCLPATLVLSA